jgi:hypothetical protein
VVEKGDKKVSNKVTNMSLSEIMNQFDSLVKGKSLFDKFFSQAHDFFTPQDSTDMDIKLLRKACGLAEDASEQEVLDWINANQPAAEADPEPETDPVDPEADPEPETDPAVDPAAVDAKDVKIADLEKQIANLKKAPGAVDKKVTKATDADAAVNDSFETYQSARKTYDAVNSLLK